MGESPLQQKIDVIKFCAYAQEKTLLAILPFLLLVTSFAQNQWVTTENTNAMDNITIRTSILNSDSGEKAAPIIRYTGNKPEVYIATADVLGYNG